MQHLGGACTGESFCCEQISRVCWHPPVCSLMVGFAQWRNKTSSQKLGICLQRR
jgi:hypothetical protein